MASVKQLKICSKGHRFYKSSDCPTCPVCEKEILELHGVGKTSIPILLNALASKELTFRK
jgi:hypothetical protein